MLFYVAEQSQKEVAELLGITTNTVKQRLYSARRRLRGRMAEEMAGELNEQRPSQNQRFAEALGVRLQRFGGDYESLAALMVRSDAGAPAEHLDVEEDRREWLANREAFGAKGLIPSAYMVERRDTGETVAYGCIERVERPRSGEYPPTGRPGESTYRVHVAAVRGAAGDGVVASLYERLEQDALELGARTLWCRDTSEHLHVIDSLRAAGFDELYRVHEWHVAVADWPLAETAAGSVTVTTLREEMERNPDYVGALQAFWNAPGRPTTGEPLSREEVERRLAQPHVVPASYFLAAKAGRIIGALILRPPHSPGSTKGDMVIQVLDAATGLGVEKQLLAGAVAYGRSAGLVTFTTYFRDEVNDPAYLVGIGLRRSIELIVLEKRLVGSS
jgi:hypothetical protein